MIEVKLNTYLRFEHTTNGHSKYWEIGVFETGVNPVADSTAQRIYPRIKANYVIHTRWGKIGNTPKDGNIPAKYDKFNDSAISTVESLFKGKLKKGYVFKEYVAVGGLGEKVLSTNPIITLPDLEWDVI